jgi:glucose-6-phosphate 1-dehydrogenase
LFNENPLREGMRLPRVPQSNVLVILGATGDLTRRKLVPALYSLYKQKLLPTKFKIVAFARRDKSTTEFRQNMLEALQKYAGVPIQSTDTVNRFLENIVYFKGDFNTLEAHKNLATYLADLEKAENIPPNHLFYLATPPSTYESIIEHIGAAGLAITPDGWTRIIIEKPFGRDLESAKKLGTVVSQVFKEDQVYRIDHYLGKETVQNILVFRFANGIFEPIWNRRYIDHVQITMAESIGMEGRGAFYQETGILRDILQNHLLQLLSLVGMEPPSTFEADAVRDEKVKVLYAVQPLTTNEVDHNVIRAQYANGSLWGEAVPGFKHEDGIPEDSSTETYVSMKLFLNNWRWAGVPFYIRTGKRLPKRVTEIAIYFKSAPLQIFGPAIDDVSSNMLALNIQPDEGIALKFDSKVPGPSGKIRPVTMDFRYGTSFGEKAPDAYERLLLDAMMGDSTLFTRADESEMAWELVNPILQRWQETGLTNLPLYKAGGWGPIESDELLEKSGHSWRRL